MKRHFSKKTTAIETEFFGTETQIRKIQELKIIKNVKKDICYLFMLFLNSKRNVRNYNIQNPICISSDYTSYSS